MSPLFVVAILIFVSQTYGQQHSWTLEDNMRDVQLDPRIYMVDEPLVIIMKPKPTKAPAGGATTGSGASGAPSATTAAGAEATTAAAGDATTAAAGARKLLRISIFSVHRQVLVETTYKITTMMLLLFAAIIGISSVACQPQIDQADPYNRPYQGDTSMYNPQPDVVMADKSNYKTALKAVKQQSPPDSEALMDMEDADNPAHAPIHGAIIMPRMAQQVPAQSSASSQGQPGAHRRNWFNQQLETGDPYHVDTMESSYYPVMQQSDNTFIMVDDPILIVEPMDGSSAAPGGTTAAGAAPTTASP
ncbi:hypothetical protein HDE_14285 [Halotydeus destructor]|nr:hypothetical protein HDE_14285 [Halotydeus destructor]